MKTAIELVGFGGLVPAAVAIVLWQLGRRFLPGSAAQRYPAALALGGAFFVGYTLLPDWAPLRPARHWHWLPYLGATAMIAAPIGLAAGVSRLERWLLRAAVAVVAACLLVPTWSKLEGERTAYVVFLACYVFALSELLDPLPVRLPGSLLVPLLAAATACAAILVAAEVSVKLGQLGGIATATMLGCAVADRFGRSETIVRGMLPAFSVIVCGLAFAGYVEPQPMLTGLLLVPAAPLALWTCVVGPLSRLRGMAAAASQIVAVAVPLAVALVLVLMRRSATEATDYYY